VLCYTIPLKWNKLKKIVKENLHPIFKDKMDFVFYDSTGWWYSGGTFYILYDKHILVSFASESCEIPIKNKNKSSKYKSILVLKDEFGESLDFMNKIIGEEDNSQLICPSKILLALFEVFNNLSIKDALNNENKIIRAIALLDKRCGKRTFKKLNYSQEENFLLRKIYILRKTLENSYIGDNKNGRN